jgi:nucleoside-diphosphate-sugar epimerase
MDLVEKLGKWVSENPEAADAPTINVTTGKEFTIREILEELKKAEAEEIEIVDEEVIAVRGQIEKWLGEV